MRRFTRTVLLASSICSLAALIWAAESAPVSAPASAPTPPAVSNVVAKVGDKTLTEADMRKDLGNQLYQAENQVYQVEKGWIDKQAKNMLFDQAAKEAGLSRQDWEKREIDSQVAAPSEKEIDNLTKQYPKAPNMSTDTYRQQIVQYLSSQKRSAQEQKIYDELQKKTPVQVLVVKPEAPHIDVTYSADDPVRGPKNAPVTIVEFTDFQCPFCQRSQATLRQVEKAYPKDVKLVARCYPLPFHNRAKPAAEAALCAKEQGKYWEYRDKLFAISPETGAPSQTQERALSDDDFKRFAQELHLNTKKFEQCLSENRYSARIDGDIADGQRFGVSGTPAFFVNGVMINGAQPFDNFKQAIDDALAKKKS
jgi:protein-disulfide isomerase